MARFTADASAETESTLNSDALSSLQELLLDDPRAIAPEVRYVDDNRRLHLRFQVEAASEDEAQGVAATAIDQALVRLGVRFSDAQVEISPGAE